MRNALHDIHRLYRNLVPADPGDALRITHPLGSVWYAGSDRVLAPEPAKLDTPWCQLGVVPDWATDGIEDRLIVCDASLAQHKLAWRVDAEANQGNVFLSVARDLDLVRKAEAVFPGRFVLISGVLVDPLGEARFVARQLVIDGVRQANARACVRLGVDTG